MSHHPPSRRLVSLAATPLLLVGLALPAGANAPAPSPAPADPATPAATGAVDGSPVSPGTRPVTVGPGDPLRMPLPGSPVIGPGVHEDAGSCSANIPGTVTDSEGRRHRVLLTAGHCLNQNEVEGMPVMEGTVYVPTREGDVRIGRLGPHDFDPEPDQDLAPWELPDATLNGPDWAFIDLDDNVTATSVTESFDENGGNQGEPVMLVGIVDYPDLEPGQVAVDNFGRPVCTDGNRTGRQCGYQVFRVRNGVWAVALGLDHGDSGGMAYDPETREVVGINSMAVGPFNRFQPADIAVEEAYGIPDGEVNEHFEPAGNPEGAGRREQYRTIADDVAVREAHATPEAPAGPGSRIREAVGETLPEDALPAPARQAADAAALAVDAGYEAAREAGLPLP